MHRSTLTDPKPTNRSCRSAIRASASLLALCVAAPAQANCPGPVPGQSVTCTVTDDTIDGSVFTLDANATTAQATYTLNNSATLSADTVYGTSYYALELTIDGADGTGSSADGVAGGIMTVTNSGDIDLYGSGTQQSTTSNLAGIIVDSEGGDGAQPDDNGTDGGRGGDGGTVSITNSGTITIQATASSGFATAPAIWGLSAESRAGTGGDMNSGAGDQKGGNSGDSKAVTVANTADISLGTSGQFLRIASSARGIRAVTQGNSGGSENGSGGTGGPVTVTNSGAVSVYANVDGSADYGVHGIFAQSNGGGGIASEDNSDDGGAGEDGRAVTLTNSGDIHVEYTGASPGNYSAGIYVHSSGGDGGASSDKSTGGIGGMGSADTDGDSSTTVVTLSGGTVSTVGETLPGVIVRSEGGAGGDGNGSKTSSTGGRGGFGGSIQVSMTGNASISTSGAQSYGILGQSIGGLGGDNAATGGKGGDAGAVRANTSAGTSITTQGDYSVGITYHSVGGGGGTGDDFTGVLAGSGGNGGNGGNAGQVTLTSASTVTTTGDHAYGLLGQSIGGSGGTGGISEGLTLELGGDGGAGGEGEVVEINNTGAITTSGDYAIGILGQSLSGGGGAAGMAGGILSIGGSAGSSSDNSATSYITNSGDITTTGAAAYGIVMQSIGGGGGSGGGTCDDTDDSCSGKGIYGIGGSGSGGGDGGVARIYAVDGSVVTSGDHAYGLVSQSIGGGGGNGGDASDISIAVGVGIGGSGSGGGSGGTACATNIYTGCGSPSDEGSEAPQGDSSTIRTSGSFAHGVVVQALGGGGGNGGDFVGDAAASLVSIQIGGSAGKAGDGGSAKVHFETLDLMTNGDNAKGIIVQSTGGGGGNGGNSAGFNGATPLAFQIGGSGTGGGKGGTATVTLDGSSLVTSGANAGAILAQSTGGGGGTGGAAVGGNVSLGFTMDVAVGGIGGGGGSADEVDVTISDSCISTGFKSTGTCGGSADSALTTAATSSHGLSMQANGGGGGTGGTSMAAALTAAFPTGDDVSAAITGTISLGGAGGDGGDGSAVDAMVSGNTLIATGGDGSYGIFAQSIGGGGGDGGSAGALSASVGTADSISADVAASIGGFGGGGGYGSTIDITLQDSASVVTYGTNANAILAQSIGGGGGDGNVGNATNDKIGRGLNLSANIGLGGRGGSGGAGGTVTIELDADTTVATYGTGSHGLVAQSIGGGGGTGQGGSVGLTASGFTLSEVGEIKEANGSPPNKVLKFKASSKFTLNIGGTTGNGNSGGRVIASTAGTIATQGDDADAVVVQSIGGGGGIGGTAGNSSANNSTGSLPHKEIVINTSVSNTLSFGGTGGTGADGGNVSLTHSGAVATQGDYADGIVVQSIGGGGGAGGSASNGDGAQTVQVNMALGGTGGTGGDGGEIDVTFDTSGDGATVATRGIYANGILLQSIGGGGGHGAAGSASGAGSTGVDYGGGSISSLSIDAGISLGAGLGGNGGASGNGGKITATSNGMISVTTAGKDAHAVMAQSIGAGGGHGVAGWTQQGDGDLDVSLSVDLGGDGGAAGSGGTIDITTAAAIRTQGARAIGMLLQSIGGGGGTGGLANSENTLDITLQSTKGSSGSGNAVTLNLSSGSSISTTGVGAHAINAQSIGGGGGIAGDIGAGTLDTNQVTGGTDPSSGSGGAVTLTVDADIATTGDTAYGILAQSIGGRGGLWGSDGTLYAGTAGGTNGTSSTVKIVQDGTITTSGSNSIGIFGQSASVKGNGTVDITVSGMVTGGTDDGAGVYVSEGNANTLNIDAGGSVVAGGSTDDGTAGDAIRYVGTYDSDSYSLVVNNNGTIDGNVLLQPADTSSTTAAQSSAVTPAARQIAGQVNNSADATWRLGDRSVAHVVNDGLITTVRDAPGRTFTLTGDFRQASNGILEIGTDFAGAGDTIHFDGDVTLDGKLRIAATGIAPGTTHSALSFAGDMSGTLEAEDTAAVDYRLQLTETQALISVADTRFGSAYGSLDSNQQAVGEHLDAIFASGADGYAEVLAGLNALTTGEDGDTAYAAGLSSFTPGSALAAAATQAMFARARMDSALRCRAPYTAAPDSTATCTWADIGGQTFDQDGTGGYDGDQFVVSGGARTMLDSEWQIGVALGYEHNSFTADQGNSTAEGDGGYLALAIGRTVAGFELGAAVSASYGSYDLDRGIVGASTPTTAEGDTDIASFGARLHAARIFGGASGWVRPALDIDVVHTEASGYTETGAGVYNLAVQDQSQTILIATPSVELGRSTALSGGRILTFFAGASLSLSNADEWTSVARLAMADPGAGSFISSVPVADQLGHVTLGLSLARSDRFEARVEYGGSFGSDFASHGIGIGLTARF